VTVSRPALVAALLLACSPRPPAVQGAAVAGPQPPAPTGPPRTARWSGPTIVAQASVVAVGDLLMHGNVQRSAAAAAKQGVPHGGFPALWAGVHDRVAAADLAFANLETPVAPEHDQGTRSFVFNVDDVLLDALKADGFDVVSFANNHVYDQGRAGFVETLDHLDASGLAYVGAGRTCADAIAPRLLDVAGLKVAFLGATKLFNSNLNAGPDQPCAAKLDLPTALASVRHARDQGADVVLFSVHWGVEYRVAPEPSEVADAHALIEGGVDVVIGHHPHVIQPIEVVETADGRTGVVAYSLGNFVSNQAWWFVPGVTEASKGRSRDGLMLAFEVVKKDYGPLGEGQRVRTSIADVRGVPLWTDSDATAAAVPAPTIRVVALPEALEQAYAQVEAATTPADRVRALQRVELVRTRWGQVEDIVGEAFTTAAPP
jgi:poly-gamma-glutamate synthesis protein (capsule biosynthesis protein)